MPSTDDEQQPSVDLTIDELHQLAGAVDGVAKVEVDLREDGRPRVRVWLDGSVDSTEVSVEIEDLVSHVFTSSPRPEVPPKRSGLGRRLEEMVADDLVAPEQLLATEPEEQTTAGVHLSLVAVEETAGGISVRASDSSGGIAFSPVSDPRSLNQAVVSAVARLRRETPTPRLAGVELRDVDGSPVLTVVLSHSDGRRLVGASLVEGGMPFTLGKAVWEALGPVN